MDVLFEKEEEKDFEVGGGEWVRKIRIGVRRSEFSEQSQTG